MVKWYICLVQVIDGYFIHFLELCELSQEPNKRGPPHPIDAFGQIARTRSSPAQPSSWFHSLVIITIIVIDPYHLRPFSPASHLAQEPPHHFPIALPQQSTQRHPSQQTPHQWQPHSSTISIPIGPSTVRIRRPRIGHKPITRIGKRSLSVRIIPVIAPWCPTIISTIHNISTRICSRGRLDVNVLSLCILAQKLRLTGFCGAGHSRSNVVVPAVGFLLFFFAALAGLFAFRVRCAGECVF